MTGLRTPPILGSLGLALVLAANLSATSFELRPLRVELSSPDAVAAVHLRNRRQETVLIQTRVVHWRQTAEGDLYTDSQDLILSPPIFELGRDQQQVVRVGYRPVASALDQEASYRIFFTEVPTATPEASTAAGLRFNLSLAIPVFIAPRGAVVEDFAWSWAEEDAESVRLRLENRGNVHLQVKTLNLESAGVSVASSTAGSYLLPGRSHLFILDAGDGLPDRDAMPLLTLVAETDRGQIRREIPRGHTP